MVNGTPGKWGATPAKENLEGVEVTVKYAACPKELLEILMVKLVIISFYVVLVYSFNCCFILHKPEICLKCHCFMLNVCLYYIKRKMGPTIFHTFLNLV